MQRNLLRTETVAIKATLLYRLLVCVILFSMLALTGCGGPDDPQTQNILTRMSSNIPPTASLTTSFDLDGSQVQVTGGFDKSHIFITFPVKLDTKTVQVTIVRTASNTTLQFGDNPPRQIDPPPSDTSASPQHSLLSMYFPASYKLSGSASFDPLNYGKLQNVYYYGDETVNDKQVYHLHGNADSITNVYVAEGKHQPQIENDLWIDQSTYHPVKIDGAGWSFSFSDEKTPAQSAITSTSISGGRAPIAAASLNHSRTTIAPLTPSLPVPKAPAFCSGFSSYSPFPHLKYYLPHNCINDLSHANNVADALLSLVGTAKEDFALPAATLVAILTVYIEWLSYLDDHCYQQGADLYIDINLLMIPVPHKRGFC